MRLTWRWPGWVAVPALAGLLLLSAGGSPGRGGPPSLDPLNAEAQALAPAPVTQIGVQGLEEGGMILIYAADLESLPEPPEGQLTMKLEVEPIDIPGKFGFFETVKETERLFTTKVIEPGQPIPRGAPIDDGIIFVTPGEFRKVEVVYENTSDQEVTFLVPVFRMEPLDLYPQIRNRCMCAAIPFTVPAGGAWLRTIAMTVGPKTEPGGKLIVRWLAVSEE